MPREPQEAPSRSSSSSRAADVRRSAATPSFRLRRPAKRRNASSRKRRSGKYSSPRFQLQERSPPFLTTPQNDTSRERRAIINASCSGMVTLTKVELDEVTTRDIAHITDSIRNAPSEAAHALVAIKIFFNWCVRRGYVTANPCSRLTWQKSKPRDRVLTAAEIRIVYCHAESFPYPFGAIVRLLILTGQRRARSG